MLTVHKLPTTHLILADNDIARAARETGIEEVLVVIDRGAIVHVHTPPDLKPGTIATGGMRDSSPFVAIGDAKFVSSFGGRQRSNPEREAFTAIWFGQHHRANAFTFKPHSDRAWPFFKVLRAGLTNGQMRAIVTEVESGEDIEAVLANLAPEAT